MCPVCISLGSDYEQWSSYLFNLHKSELHFSYDQLHFCVVERFFDHSEHVAAQIVRGLEV